MTCSEIIVATIAINTTFAAAIFVGRHSGYFLGISTGVIAGVIWISLLRKLQRKLQQQFKNSGP